MSEFVKGQKVRFVDHGNLHATDPEFFPPSGTIGKVVAVDRYAAVVRWPKKSGVAKNSRGYVWSAAYNDLEVVG
jgi:hypothetical protein